MSLETAHSISLAVALAAALSAACQAELEPSRSNASAGGSAGSDAQGGAGSPNATGGSPSGGASAGGASSSAGAAGSGGSDATGGAAGTSGSGGAEAAGSAGAEAGGSGGTSGEPGAPIPSSGCDTPAQQDLGQWVQRSFTIRSTQRDAWVRLPLGYDPARPYPVVFLFHGCTNITNNVPMWNVTGNDAILVRGAGISNNICWDSGPNSADIELFDAMVESVSNAHCIDTSRIFGVGYSSGSWLLNRLECVRGDVLRAVGTVAGGGTNNPNSCVGTVARVFVHDTTDNDNPIQGNYAERDRLIALNGCNAGLPPVPEGPAPCARYQGCDPENPVIWCETTGAGHGRQDSLASQAFWGLFNEL
jgi:polyhydroxybutyrate depolymerase